MGIDYALFIVTRHRGFMEQGHPVDEAAARAVGTAGGAVVFAGGTVVIALCSLAVAQIPIVSALGYSAAIVVLIAVITAVTLLPALLSILGKRIDALRVPFLRPPAHDDRPHGWARWARGVGKRPLPAMLLGVGILLVLAIPVLNLQLGQQDNGQMPKSTETRQAYDLLRQGFGSGINGPFLIAVDFDGSPAHNDNKKLNQLKQQQQQQEQQAVEQTTAQLEAQGLPPDEAQSEAEQEVSSQPPTKQEKQASQQEAFLKTPASDPRLVKLENQIGKTKGVKDVSPATLDKSGDTAVFTVIATTAPSDDVDLGPRPAPALAGDPRSAQGDDADRLRGRPDRRLHRPRRPDQRQASARDRHRAGAQLPPATDRVPLDRRAAHGGAHEPALGGSRVRHPHLRLPGGSWRDR